MQNKTALRINPLITEIGYIHNWIDIIQKLIGQFKVCVNQNYCIHITYKAFLLQLCRKPHNKK